MRLYHASPSLREAYRGPRTYHALDHAISPDSLTRTLRDHRAANLSRRIQKVQAGTDPSVIRPSGLPEPQIKETKKSPRGPRRVLSKEFYASVAAEAEQLKPISESDPSLPPVSIRKFWKSEASKPWTSSNGYMTRRREVSCIKARKLLVSKYGAPGVAIPAEEESLEAQMEILRLTRTVVLGQFARYKNDVEIINRVRAGILEYVAHNIPISSPPGSQRLALEPWASSGVNSRHWGLKRSV